MGNQSSGDIAARHAIMEIAAPEVHMRVASQRPAQMLMFSK